MAMTRRLVLLGLCLLTRASSAAVPWRASRGWGRDVPLAPLRSNRTHQCIEPPPPFDFSNGTAAAAATAVAAAPPPDHLKYLALDGDPGSENTSGWTNLAFLPLAGPEGQGPGVNVTDMEAKLAMGYDLMLNVAGITILQCVWSTDRGIVHTVAAAPASRFAPKQHQAAQKVGPDIHCADKWRAIWFGNATHGGVWNQTVQKLAQDKKIIGVYVGDELLGGKITVSNLTAIFDLIKSAWPEGITYYNEEWPVFNDPAWRDGAGAPYTQVPASLDWVSYDFYRLNNVSWLQPMCEYLRQPDLLRPYPQNLYTKMAPHQRAVLLPGAWGSTSGPRGGAAQFKLNCSSCPGPTCTPLVDMSCTSDPFSCSNLPGVSPSAATNQSLNGLAWEADNVLTQLGNDGNRPATCWMLDQYDSFNVENALGYYHWAVSDPRIVAINIWPWSGWLPPAAYPGVNVGLKQLPNATAAWSAIGKAIKLGRTKSKT